MCIERRRRFTLAERFKFGLDKLLEIRKAKEEESKRLFTESQREKKKIEEKLEELNQSYHKYKGITPNEDVVYQKLKRYYIQGVQSGIKSNEKELAIKDQEVDKRRRDLTVKQMERKTVQTLKEKKYESYVKEQDRVEQINLDELALYAYVKNKHNEQ
jgi:flagellar protein FliJ